MGTTIPTMTAPDPNAAQVLDEDHHHPDFAEHGYHPEFWEMFHPRTARITRSAAALHRETAAARQQVPNTHPIWQPDRHEAAATALQSAENIAALLERTIRDANRRIFQVAPPEYRAKIHEDTQRALHRDRHLSAPLYYPPPPE